MSLGGSYTRFHMRARQSIGLFSLLCWTASSCVAPEPARPQSVAPPAPPSLEVQTIELERASRAGPEHHRLSVLCGAWNVTMVAVDEHAAETEIARGEGELAWMLDGRFLHWTATLSIAGAPRTTTGFLGFNTRSKEYELLMISNLATGMQVASGRGDPERGGLRFTLEQLDPATGARIRATSLLRLLTKDHFALDQTANDASGVERVVQRHHYRRRAAAPAASGTPASGTTTSAHTRGG